MRNEELWEKSVSKVDALLLFITESEGKDKRLYAFLPPTLTLPETGMFQWFFDHFALYVL